MDLFDGFDIPMIGGILGAMGFFDDDCPAAQIADGSDFAGITEHDRALREEMEFFGSEPLEISDDKLK